MKICGIMYVIKAYADGYKWASQPDGLEGIVLVLDGYDESSMLIYCNRVKLF